MSNAFASTDPNVLSFIAAQNVAAGGRGSAIPFAPGLLHNGIAGTATDNVIGLAAIAAGQAPIALGSGINAVVIDGAHSPDPAATAADNVYFSVASSGAITLTDSNSLQSETVTGASFLIFKGAATNADGTYQSIYFIGNANQTEITELYNAAFGRQPDLGGVEYYLNQLKAGLSFQLIASEFIASPEFQTRYGANVSDAQFISNLYQNVLHRAPAAGDIAWYQTNVIAPVLTGAVAGSAAYTAAGQVARAVLLQDFTNSAENQADVSGWVINSSATATNGVVFADPAPKSQAAQAVLTSAQSSGIFDTNLIDTSAYSAPVQVGRDVLSPYANGPRAGAFVLTIGDLTGNIVLSKAVNEVFYNATAAAASANLSVVGAAGGGSSVEMDGGTAQLFGTGNSVTTGALLSQSVVTVTGFVPGDLVGFYGMVGGNNGVYSVLVPSPSAPFNATNVDFTNINTPVYIINVGAVGGGTAAEVAAAANLVYVVGDKTIEAAIFFGQTSSGNTVLFNWHTPLTNGLASNSSADTNGNHLVDATEFLGGIMLVGVPSSSISAASFVH